MGAKASTRLKVISHIIWSTWTVSQPPKSNLSSYTVQKRFVCHLTWREFIANLRHFIPWSCPRPCKRPEWFVSLHSSATKSVGNRLVDLWDIYCSNNVNLKWTWQNSSTRARKAVYWWKGAVGLRLESSNTLSKFPHWKVGRSIFVSWVRKGLELIWSNIPYKKKVCTCLWAYWRDYIS